MSLAAVLVKAGANVNAKDAEGCTPLHRAASGNDLSLVTALVKAGADVNAKDNRGDAPIHKAARRTGTFPTIRVLVDLGADDKALDGTGMSVAELQERTRRSEEEEERLAKEMAEPGYWRGW
jgi:ankyrin repeat protein